MNIYAKYFEGSKEHDQYVAELLLKATDGKARNATVYVLRWNKRKAQFTKHFDRNVRAY